MPCDICNDGISFNSRSRVDVRHASDIEASAKECPYCRMVLAVLAEHNVEPGQRLHVANDQNTSTSRCTHGIKFLVIKAGQIYGSQFDFVIRNLRAIDTSTRQSILCSGLTYTGGPQALLWALGQLANCMQTHYSCKPKLEAWPDRLLELGKGTTDDSNWLRSDVKLCERIGGNGLYATLSHRWGSRQPLRLLKSNISDFKDRIPWLQLPKTFQDAVSFARRLGISYLWIDSLCIIQDSKEDWEAQAVKMASIYENSILTLAASVAEDSGAGCFTDPPAFLKGYVTDGNIKVGADDREAVTQLEEEAGGKNLVFIRGSPEHPMPSSQLPLLLRGWVFQERLLSSRVLHFSHMDLIYECSWSMECYCKKQVGASTRQTRNHPPKFQHANALGQGMVKGRGGTPNAYTQRWCAIIEEYSGLELSFATDRLPALAGLAKQMARYMPDADYICGIWTTNIPVYLCWQRKWKSPCINGPRSRDGPSWSWATMPGQLYYPSGSFFFERDIGYDPTVDPWPTVLGFDLGYQDERDYMTLGDRTITLNGVLVPVRLLKFVEREIWEGQVMIQQERNKQLLLVVLDHEPDDDELRDSWESAPDRWDTASIANALGGLAHTETLQPREEDAQHAESQLVHQVLQHKETMWAFYLAAWHTDGAKTDIYLLLQRSEHLGRTFRRIGLGSHDSRYTFFRDTSDRHEIVLK